MERTKVLAHSIFYPDFHNRLHNMKQQPKFLSGGMVLFLGSFGINLPLLQFGFML